MIRLVFAAGLACCLLSVSAWAQAPATTAPPMPMPAASPGAKPLPGPERWESEIQRFERLDTEEPFPKGQNLFVGSSSIRLWDIESSFPGVEVLNRGFGGSKFPDLLAYFDRLVPPHAPRVIVIYCGDNDVGMGHTSERIFEDYREFASRVHRKLPETKIVFIAIKPSPRRWARRDIAHAANEMIRKSMADHPNEVYIDVWQPMLGADGLPRRELYVKDELHMSPAGYQLWNELVRPHLVAAEGTSAAGQ